MKIKSTHTESQGLFVIINDDDYNPEIHQKYVDSGESSVEKKPAVLKKNARSRK